MNEILLYSLIILFIIGIIGLGIFINFYFETKRKLFNYYIPGWIFFVLGQITPIISIFFPNILISNIFVLMYGLFTPTGVFLIAIGGISYFAEVPIQAIVISCISFLIIPLLLYLTLGIDIALNFSFISFTIALLSTFLVPLITWDSFRKILGKSINLYFIAVFVVGLYAPVVIIVFSQGYSFGLFFSNDSILITLNYSVILAGTILTIIHFTHLEFSIMNKERFDLKEKYSHIMGNLLQTIYLSVGLLKVDKDLTNKERKDLAEVIEEKIDNAKKFLDEIREIK